MPTLSFGEYRPDLSDLDGSHSRLINNVLPRGDGYGPIMDIAELTTALPAACRGYFYARDDDGAISVFAGTATKLYLLNNTDYSWSDVSVGGGSYTTLSSDANWSFAQFGLIVIACQGNDDVQAYTLGSSATFDDLAGSPPDADYVTVVNSFVVLSGLTANPFRVQWSALGSAIGWTAGTNSSDFQDLQEGGIVRAVIGGDLGLIFQDLAIRRMSYAPGSDVIFQIDHIGKGIGLLHPYAVTAAGDKVFFLSSRGFMQADASGSMLPIGAERVDNTFLSSYDSGAQSLILAAVDPRKHVVVFTYRSAGNVDAVFDRALAYNWLLQRWAPFDITGEYMTSLARPGLTLEGLDAIAPGAMTITGAADNGSGLIRITVADTDAAPHPIVTGDYRTISAVTGTTEANGTWEVTRISGTTFDLVGSAFANAYVSGGIVGGSADLMATSWDALSTSTLPSISVVDSLHQISFFTGDNLEATLETSEKSGDGQRLLVRGFWPITDADDVRGKVGKRETLSAARTYTAESTMNASHGLVPQLRSTRYATAFLRIPSGTAWTFASGVRPDAVPDGEF